MAVRGISVAALVSLALSSVTAQEPRRLVEAESIPLELAAALAANGSFGGEPQILVGAMPEWASNRIIIPQGGRIVGSGFLGSTLVAIVSVAGEPDAAIPSLKEQLLQHGWKNPPPPVSYGGGFRSAPNPATAAAANTRLTLCGDQQMLTVTGTHRRMGGTEISYRLVSTASYSVCRPPEPPPGAYRAPYPTLFNPPGATDGMVPAGNCSGNYSGTGTSTMLRTPMTPEAVLDHYGRQIVDSGWAVGGVIAGRTWTKKDSTGAPLEMSLTVSQASPDGGCQRVDLQLKTFRKP